MLATPSMKVGSGGGCFCPGGTALRVSSGGDCLCPGLAAAAVPSSNVVPPSGRISSGGVEGLLLWDDAAAVPL
ncbi:hypothetical protein TSOC_007919 [Tetrabaena socialis]|uniref:Uncharacterized protein n=1 Tax=Tetrabaena socialis TaxID=47790 RepID=A0A2J7ZZW6_9CHLO|nr:hypothetical protein TSOC_007919 [Tetrabaena socialis]|eukprot:PNH05812.1 hypothetical protein TSOC_007919 [Tetrabaena socialis]